MPATRKAGLATASPAVTETTDSRKRKRGELASTTTETALQSSPRRSGITKTKEEPPPSPATGRSTTRSRRKKVKLGIEEEKKIAVTAARNGSLTVQEETDAKVEKTEETSVQTTKTRSRKGAGRPAKSKAETAAEEDVDAGNSDEGVEVQKPKRKRRTKEEKEAEARPLASRTVGLKMFVGAHTSIAKGLENAITNCVHIGGNAFACFLKSQRKWENPPLKDENRDAFVKGLIEHQYDGGAHIVPHGSYLVNLATEDEAKAQQSYETFIDDLHRCEALGIRYYNFHPGGAGQSPFDEAVTRLATRLNRALAETSTVVPLLENMAGHGTLIGGRFEDLRDVIAQIKPEYRSRIGVCIDTCHGFAAGYDFRTPEAFKKTMADFDETVGIQYLKALHLNDSKAPFNSHRDLHQNIGLGFLGLRAFHNVMNEPQFQGLPLILETPCERPDPEDPTGKKTIDDKTIWATEIKLLESLIGMDPESDTFKNLERELSERGKKERDEMQAQFDKKVEKERIKIAKQAGKEKGQTTLSFGKINGKGEQKENNTRGEEGDEESELSELSDLGEDEDNV
ncbi:AP endonuclease 1 [Capronia coronata CBS 617.96]|uniref:Apurinic-apyrimidinic endonuclease 1 n=1 Tax=Capronia coronata CBS 617.96 TaxID=1182541 RepID=W9YMN9_9EURO|nr:AP endonuclease 1 [Capronia coronata CBS 617.96]EXJ90925.1 AP endonuclease 1 [Capronia coronata CBS 617.96]